MDRLRTSKSQVSARNGESGTAILEFSALLPFLVMMIISVIEIGNAVNQYLQVARIAYEGARYGSTLAGYEQGDFDSTKVNQALVQHRMRRLLTDYGFVVGSAHIYTSLGEPAADAEYRLVTVAIDIPVRPVLFSNYAWIRLRTASWAPHLFVYDG